MGKTILIAGKNMPDAGNFTEGIALSGRNIIVTGLQTEYEGKRLTIAERKQNQANYEEEKLLEAKTGICTIEWNKASPLSARSLVLQTATIYSNLDEAVLYFDEEWYASKANKMDSEEVARASDEMLVGYQYLALEILSSFQRRETKDGPGTLVFLIKEGPSPIDVFRSPALKTGLSAISSPIVAACASAFSSFAENIAALYHDSIFANIVLVRGDRTTEGFRRDDETGKWLCTYLNSLEKNAGKPDPKRPIQWVKPGSKPSSGGFLFFKR